MILVLGSVTVEEGSFFEALALSREHVSRSRAEPGCVAHAVHRDTEDPRRLVFVEEWTDQAALARHFEVPASKAFVEAVTAMAVEAPRIATYEASQVSGSGVKPR